MKLPSAPGQCTSINYYTDRGSHVFCAFTDFSMALDRVNYWHLFNKLLDDNVSFDVVRLLALWYSHKNVAVRWHNNISDGTRQGSALSDIFVYTVYSGYFIVYY